MGGILINVQLIAFQNENYICKYRPICGLCVCVCVCVCERERERENKIDWGFCKNRVQMKWIGAQRDDVRRGYKWWLTTASQLKILPM